MKIVGYYVTKGGVPCAFTNITGSYRGGLLVPVSDLVTRSRTLPAAAFFNKRRDANRAMHRSQEAATKLPGSLVEDWARKHVPSYFSKEPFAVWPLGKQLKGLPATPTK
jgi:hypothetical protein